MTHDDASHPILGDDSPARPVIGSQADLEACWRTLMTPLGFGAGSVWLMLIGPDDRPVPQLTEITDADHVPGPDLVGGLARLLTHLRDLDEIARVAFLRARPGRSGVTAEDRAWARALYQASRDAGMPCEVVHRACDHDLVPLPLDAILGDDAA